MLIFLSLVAIAASALVFYLKHLLGYWQKRGIACDEPEFPAGNMKGWRVTKHLHEMFDKVYEHHKGSGPFAGFYFYLKPVVLALDLDFIKNVLIKDFNYFVNRGVFYNEIDDPLSAHLFAIEDEYWRSLRNKLSPTFTSGKMKFMYPTVLQVGEELARVCGERVAKDNGVVEVADLVSRYTADSIGSCAFGLDCNSLSNPKADFVVMGKKAIIERRHHKIIDSYLIEAFPKLARKLRLRQVHQECHDFYMRIVRDTVNYRTKHNIQRKDFVDLLLNINKDKEGVDALTMNEIAAQSFVFFLAGFDTSSTTMGYALYELARNQEVQERVRAEVNETLKKHNNDLSYECVNEMKYLQQAISETLRIYPVVVNLFRKAKEDYTPSDPKYHIEKGTTVIIPVYAIQHDPDIYPDPEKFDPDRFSDEEVLKRHACAHLPFGEGPRNCIGMRFGKMQSAVGLAMLLRNYRFSTGPDMKKPHINIASPLLNVESGIYLKVEKLE